MGIEKKFEKLRQRVVKAEANSSNALKVAGEAVAVAEEATAACAGFRKAVEELMKHSASNGEAIVEHIAQLDTEKEEVIGEYRTELKVVQNDFNKAVRELETRLSNLGKRTGDAEGEGA